MAESSQSATSVLLERLPELCVALSAAASPYHAQLLYAVAVNVSFTEEPDVGDPQVRFCEGH